MGEEKIKFLEVVGRLKLVLGIAEDAAVAGRLGLSTTAFNNRKLRGSLPTAAIDALLDREELNPEFIYQGTGPVHVPVDGAAWGKRFSAALADALKHNEGWLVREGYKKTELKAIAAGKAALPPEALWRLVRDLRQVCRIDLNSFFCDEPTTAMNADEEALVAAYRTVDKTGKAFILNASGLAVNVKKK